MKLHNIHTISVEDTQTMLMTDDFELLIKEGKPLFFKRSRLAKAHAEFIESLNELFSSEDIKQRIDKGQVIQRFKLKIQNMERLQLAISNVYMVKDTPKKIQILDKLKAQYREFFNKYPDLVDLEADNETYQKQIEAVLMPIKNEIRRLTIKIKTLAQKKEEAQQEDDNIGLLWAVQFVENITERNYDMSRSVWQLKQDHDLSVKKYNKLKTNGKG